VGSPRILIVDDEPFNVEYLEQELEELNYETISAGNGLEALEKVRAQSPDLILLDIMMPQMDGFEVLSRLKADLAVRDIPVIVISADNNLRNVVRGIELGAEDYLPKPFEPTLLYARISSCLEKKQLRDLQQLYLKGLEHELDIARDIQLSFLPSELPVADGWESAVYFKAAREVAGDFYDAFILPDGSLMCVIGDVCGKGVGAALFMALFRSLIRAASTSDIACGGADLKVLAPAELLQYVISFTNHYITETHGDASMLFSTIFMGIFSRKAGTLTYLNCGNEPPLLVRKGGAITSLLPTGPVVGVFPDAKFSVCEIPMEVNDMLIAFTDGIPDALNAENVSFSSERLQKLLSGNAVSSEAQIDLIKSVVQQFIGEAGQFDDITLLAVKRVS
jgi:phosphoserine phosphatase RsbU/P